MADDNPITPEIKRIALAIHEARRRRIGIQHNVLDNFDDWPPEYRVSYYEDARAALEAIREPSEAMKEGAMLKTSHQAGQFAGEHWRVMIDVALGK